MKSPHWQRRTFAILGLVLAPVLMGCADQGVTIGLSRTSASAAPVANPSSVELSNNPDETWKGYGNHVRWRNVSEFVIRIAFDSAEWGALFMEPYEAEIVVPAKSVTAWYTIKPGSANVSRPYHFAGGTAGGPGEPVITAGP